ncbi:hypothetical protein Ancab_026057 [Ancistrocladus abbreviatus]
MFLNDFSRRKLSSLLRPWLITEPELQVKLGFLRSHAVAKNLRFDTSALNRLIDDTLLVSFKHVTVEELSIGVAPWSAPAFTVEVRGVNVTLSAEEREGGRVSRVVEESVDASSARKKNVLAKIDPQGSAFHESLEKIIVNASSRNLLKTSIVNAISRHIRLHMHDIHLRVDPPVSDDPFAFLWDIMEINVACQNLHGCFLGGIVGSFVRPLRESPFDVDVKRLEIRTERKEHIVCIFSSAEPYIAIRLKDHHLVDLMFHVPEMKMSLSPVEVSMILALGYLVSVESKQHRNGMQLWKLARSKIGNFLLPSGYILYKTFNVAVLCLRLAKAYEHFLLRVGYPVDETLQKTIIKISEDVKFSIPFKQQLEVILEIEKHLPAEAIAWARRVGRYGAKLKAQSAEESIVSYNNSHFKIFQKIFLLLVVVWRTICKIFEIVVTNLSWKGLPAETLNGQVGIISEGSTTHFRLSVSVGMLSVLICPLDAISNPVDRRSNSSSRISYSDLLSFCLFTEGFLLVYEGGILEQNLSFSLGCLKVMSAPVLVDSEKANSLRRYSSSFIEHDKGRMDDLDTIVWGDSAPIFSQSGISETGSLYFPGRAAIPFMDKFLGEMRPTWKRLCSRFQESETRYTGNPCLLCEFRVFSVCHDLDCPDFGFWKCNFTVGQLNFALGYTSLLSIVCLTMQMQKALCQLNGSAHGLALSNSSGTFQELPDMSWCRRFKASGKKMKMAMFNLFPNRHIELGAVIAGPLVHISLRNNESSGSTLEMNAAALVGFNLTFTFDNICLAVWPTLESGHPRYLDIDEEFFTLVEPESIDISESTIETHVSKRKISLGLYLSVDGVDAHFEDSEGNQRIQILALKPVTVKLLALRAYLHSFGTTAAAFSAASRCVMQELTVSFCMDELSVISQVVGRILSAAPTYAFGNFGLDSGRGCQASAKHEMIRLKSKTEIIFGDTEGETLNLLSDSFIITSSFKLDNVHIMLHNFRKSNGKESSLINVAADSSKQMGLPELPGDGVWLSVQRTCLDISCEGQKAEVHTDFSVCQAVIFRHKNQIGEVTNHLEVVNVFPQFFDCLYEASFSGCTFTLMLDCPEKNSSSGVSRVANTGTSCDDAESLMVNSTSESKNGSATEFNEVGSSESNRLAPGSGHWLLISISLDIIFMGRCLFKNFLIHAHQPNRLLLLLSVSEDFQRIVFGLQDVFLFVDTTVLVAFARYWTFHLHFMRNLLCVSPSPGQDTEVAEPCDSMSRLGKHHVKESAQWKLNSDCQVNQEELEALTMNLSQLFLVFLAVDESGRVQEIMWKVDLCLNIGLQDRKRKFLLNLHELKILSQVLDKNLEHTEKEIQVPHFSFASSSSSLQLVQEDPVQEVQNMERTHPQFNIASCSNSDSARKSGVDGPIYEVLQASDQHYILKELAVSVSAEKHAPGDKNDHSNLRQGWAGKGSGSGFDMIISLPEIQMLMATLESLSEVFGKEASNALQNQIQPSIFQETENRSVAAVHDGAIVAIRDVYEHLYITVECLAGKYSLAGGIHYSLVGERALFKIEYQKQRRWHFSDSWFSLVSLHGKSGTGEPMRLAYCSGSDFVHLSSTKHGASVLWKIVSCKTGSYEGDINMEPFNMLSKSTFYLVNKNSDCGVAFINGIPEFVRKPGSPFKFKMFDGSCLARDIVTSGTNCVEADGSNLELLDVGERGSEAGVIPCINLRIDKANFTIVHEISGQKEVFPLLQGCISNSEVIFQVLCCKTRVISTFIAAVNYFDSHRMQWRELIRPLETCIFYRSRLHCQVTQTSYHGVPINFYLRMKELDILVTEISLDMLLYVVGKLDLAGPFAVKSSSILANRCKVENQLDLNILCQFYDAQTARVGGKQSGFFFLRHLMDQGLESLYVSIKLDNLGTLSTSSIYLPLSETRAFAWRMRIISLQDPRTYPGPFVVFDISKNTEEGVSVVVSPLLRIHNATTLPLELHFQRPQQTAAEYASVLLKAGDTIDDCMAAFDAVGLSGGLKKALMSLSVGNFLFSFRPDIEGDMNSSNKSYSVEWSDNLKGGKAVHLSGLMDKLAYKVRNAFSAESRKYSFSTACCSVRSGDKHVGNMHFLVQSIGRDIPILKPNDDSESKNSFVAMQEQKEVFLLPTFRVTNLLQSDIHVLFSETDISHPEFFDNIGNQATVPSGSAAELYANPAIIFLTVTLVAFSSSCKPVNSGDLVKKLNKQKYSMQFLDIDLEFCGGKYFACLRLTRGDRGILEAVIFTSYTLRNDTDFYMLCSVQNQKPLSRDEAERSGSTISPNLGSYLPPRSMISWFMKSKQLRLKFLDESASQALLDLDALSGLAEISLDIDGGSGFKHLVKLGVSLGPLTSKMVVPSRIVSVVPRYVVSNESDAEIYIRQCFIEGDSEGIVGINSKQKRMLLFKDGCNMKKEITVFDKFLQKHRIVSDDLSTFVQFRPNDTGLGWSGPVCVASLGRFFLKFKRSLGSPVDTSNSVNRADCTAWEFAVIHVVEEASSFVLRFLRSPDIDLPYRIENQLNDASITYYQKDTFEPESLAAESSVDFVWDDLTRPHRLVVQINGFHLLREINLDKLRPWKPFSKVRQQSELAYNSPVDTGFGGGRRSKSGQSNDLDISKVGYEVCADGPTRVLRICYSYISHRAETISESSMKIRVRISHFSVHLLEHTKQDLSNNMDPSCLLIYAPIIVGRLENIILNSIFIDQQKYYQIRIQSINIDQKWAGAPFAAMLRRHQLSDSVREDNILFIAFVLNSTSSNVRQVKYSSLLLQPVDVNVDEETLMKIVPFWRTSLSQSTKSQQYYFDSFEIHPVKIIACFLPAESYSSYSSAQETLRSLLHSVIKIPVIKNVAVELNGVLVTHALITARELLVKCAQHYSWYIMRAIYIAKGSPLLPPTFASVFDDSASSSLDVFFDPSSTLLNVQGLTLGTFKLIRKCIERKGFSGTKRYFGDLGKTLKTAGSNILFTAVTEISDSVLKGAESSGFSGMVIGFHQGILKLAMEPSLLGTAFMEGGPDRKIKLEQSPGVDELYIEGYLQAMLDTTYKQEYLRVRVIDNEVILKNLPPNSALIDEIMDRVKDFLVSKALLKGDSSTTSHPLRRLRGEREWRILPTVLTLCEHLFVSFAIRMLRKQAGNIAATFKLKEKLVGNHEGDMSTSSPGGSTGEPKRNVWQWRMGKFVMSALVAYVDGRLCRGIPNPVARRIVGGFLLSFLDKDDAK